MMADVNWGTVVVSAIGPILLFVGVIYNDIRKRKNAKIDTSEAIALKKEPTWVELETANRALRAEMNKQQEENDKRFNEQKAENERQFKAIREEFASFRSRAERRDAAFATILNEAATQWPDTHEGPVFSADALGEVADTLPPLWRHRFRTAS